MERLTWKGEKTSDFRHITFGRADDRRYTSSAPAPVEAGPSTSGRHRDPHSLPGPHGPCISDLGKQSIYPRHTPSQSCTCITRRLNFALQGVRPASTYSTSLEKTSAFLRIRISNPLGRSQLAMLQSRQIDPRRSPSNSRGVATEDGDSHHAIRPCYHELLRDRQESNDAQAP
jgi:hypothetical protein